jgi:hypothetical protein
MKSLFAILTENKKKDEHRKVFKETDPDSPFPKDTVSAIKREVNTGAKDLDTEWENSIALLDHAFKKLEVPKPRPQQHERWKQYLALIGEAVKDLNEARGLSGSWRTTNK